MCCGNAWVLICLSHPGCELASSRDLRRQKRLGPASGPGDRSAGCVGCPPVEKQTGEFCFLCSPWSLRQPENAQRVGATGGKGLEEWRCGEL